ncbi:MAG: Arm DNA-binding domain-containing protein [Pseudomonadota bacterium]|nr:Arm DNA-binding domain-containing protein [Pseudomonadota bacterium]
MGDTGQALKRLPPKMLESSAIPELQPKAQPYKRFDEHGLFLLIQPHGGKWWRLDYRYGGRQKTISLGLLSRRFA